MIRTTVKLTTHWGFEEVEAVVVVPGLAIHRALGERVSSRSRWSLSHVGTGMRVCGPFRLQEQAINCAKAIAPLVDWTAEADAIRDSNIGAEVKRAYLDAVGLR
jgi:hypothetical protein